MQNQATPNARKFAKTLRREMTGGEQLLWHRLRGEQLGVKFRRQHPLGSYIADFACLAPRLIVEIDGSQHVGQQAYDTRRDEFFKDHGFAVMRFAANLPFSDLQSIVQAIYNRVAELTPVAPIPAFPQRGKEQEKYPESFLSPPGESREQKEPTELLFPPVGKGSEQKELPE